MRRPWRILNKIPLNQNLLAVLLTLAAVLGARLKNLILFAYIFFGVSVMIGEQREP